MRSCSLLWVVLLAAGEAHAQASTELSIPVQIGAFEVAKPARGHLAIRQEVRPSSAVRLSKPLRVSLGSDQTIWVAPGRLAVEAFGGGRRVYCTSVAHQAVRYISLREAGLCLQDDDADLVFDRAFIVSGSEGGRIRSPFEIQGWSSRAEMATQAGYSMVPAPELPVAELLWGHGSDAARLWVSQHHTDAGPTLCWPESLTHDLNRKPGSKRLCSLLKSAKRLSTRDSEAELTRKAALPEGPATVQVVGAWVSGRNRFDQASVVSVQSVGLDSERGAEP